jgi:predicted nucleotidyltransferase
MLMLYTKSQMISGIKLLASALGALNDRVVYVGGAVAGLYADDPAAPESRPTKDIDIVLEITSALKLEELRKELARRGIYFAKDSNILCRFTYQHIFVDVLSTQEVGWAPSNPWFKPGFGQPVIYPVDDLKIRIMPLPYFLAAKYTAFFDRGGDARNSHDFEDIVYLLDNRRTLVEDILQADQAVKDFLIAQFRELLFVSSLQEAVMAHLEPSTQIQRYAMLTRKLKEIIK